MIVSDTVEQLEAPESDRKPRARHYRIPAAFLALIGASFALFVLIGWLACATNLGTAAAVGAATVFATVAIGLPALLVRANKRRFDPRSAAAPGEWPAGEFVTATGRLPARDALIQILLPVAATAIGFAVIGIELAMVRGGA